MSDVKRLTDFENLCPCTEPRNMSIGIVHLFCDETGRLSISFIGGTTMELFVGAFQ